MAVDEWPSAHFSDVSDRLCTNHDHPTPGIDGECSGERPAVCLRCHHLHPGDIGGNTLNDNRTSGARRWRGCVGNVVVVVGRGGGGRLQSPALLVAGTMVVQVVAMSN